MSETSHGRWSDNDFDEDHRTHWWWAVPLGAAGGGLIAGALAWAQQLAASTNMGEVATRALMGAVIAGAVSAVVAAVAGGASSAKDDRRRRLRRRERQTGSRRGDFRASKGRGAATSGRS